MTTKAQLALLLVVTLIVGTSSRDLSAEPADVANPSAHRSLLESQDLGTEATERQRILAELEEVHQLRERMLQEGTLRLETAAALHGPAW